MEEVKDKPIPKKLEGHTEGVTDACFFPADSHFIATNGDNTVRIWDSRTGNNLTIAKTTPEGITSLCVSLDGASVFGVGDDRNSIEKWHIRTNKRQFQATCGFDIEGVEMSKDGTKLISYDWQGVDILDSKTGEIVSSRELDDPVFSAAFSPDGKQYATGDNSGCVGVWDTATGEAAWEYSIHERTELVNSVQFHANGRILISVGHFDHTLLASNAADGSEIFKMTTENTENLIKAEFSLYGEQIITASADGTARVYDTATTDCITVLPHDDIVWDARFSGDNRLALTACDDKIARIWDLRIQHGSTKDVAMFFRDSKVAKK